MQFRVNNIQVDDTVVRSWIWRRRIPQYKTTIVNGNWGGGKTTAVASIIAHIANREDFPDGELPEVELGHILWITTESDTEELGQKLKAQGMNKEDIEEYVHVLDFIENNGELMTFDIDRDVLVFEQVLRRFKPLLVVFDPFIEFHSRKEIDSKSIRGLMVKIEQLCVKFKTTFIIILHWNKNEKLSRQNRLSGSGQYQAGVKSVITVWHDEKKKTWTCSQDKHNLSSEPPDIPYEIVEPDGLLVWGKVEDKRVESKLEGAERWLLEHCSDPKPIKECVQESGYPERTLRRARQSLSHQILTTDIYLDGRMVSHWEVASEKNLWGVRELNVNPPSL